MIKGIGKKPFINLDPYLDIEGFKKLHPEICKGFALAREYAKEGTWMKPGFDMKESSYIANWKPIYKAYEEFQSLPADDPIKIKGMELFPKDMTNYKERNLFVRYLVSALGAHDPYIYYVLWEEGSSMKDRGDIERPPTPEQQYFPGVVEWVKNLKEQNIIEHIGRVIFFVSSSSSQPFEHRDLDPDTPTYTDHNVEFIHIRPFIKRGFYLWDPDTKKKHYINNHSCFFNDQDWHGGEHSMEQEYGLRIDCKFTDYFRSLISIGHLSHY